MAKVTIDGIEVEVPNGASVLQACEAAGVEIARLMAERDAARADAAALEAALVSAEARMAEVATTEACGPWAKRWCAAGSDAAGAALTAHRARVAQEGGAA